MIRIILCECANCVTLQRMELLYVGIHVDALVTIGIVHAQRSALVILVASHFVILDINGEA